MPRQRLQTPNPAQKNLGPVRLTERFVWTNDVSGDVHVDLLKAPDVVVLFEASSDPGRVTLRDDDDVRFHAGFDLDTRRGKTHLTCVCERHADSLGFLFCLRGEKFFRIDTFDDVNHERDMHGANRRLDAATTARGNSYF